MSSDDGRLVGYSDPDVEMGNGRDEPHRYRRHHSLSAIDELEEVEMRDDGFGGGSRSYPVEQQHYGWSGGGGEQEQIRDVYD